MGTQQVTRALVEIHSGTDHRNPVRAQNGDGHDYPQIHTLICPLGSWEIVREKLGSPRFGTCWDVLAVILWFRGKKRFILIGWNLDFTREKNTQEQDVQNMVGKNQRTNKTWFLQPKARRNQILQIASLPTSQDLVFQCFLQASFWRLVFLLRTEAGGFWVSWCFCLRISEHGTKNVKPSVLANYFAIGIVNA